LTVILAGSLPHVNPDEPDCGIGFYLPKPIATPQVYVNDVSVPDVPELASVAGLAQVVRKKPCGEGWYEIGAAFTHATRAKK
jgi:hypothetical protein